MKRRSISFKIILLLWIIIVQSVLCAGADTLLETISSPESNLSDLSLANESPDQSANESTDQLANDVHVYVSNKDNERLKISLFIDFDLKDTKEISSDSELKIDSYPLPAGPHLFKITWWDEDVKRSYEMQELRDIQNETSINLYTSNHEAPEKYEILVKLINENKNDLEAFLYVDDSFEKSKEIGKDSTSDLGTIKLEEGVHNLSVRWQDRQTKIEYEKTKKITVTRDDVLVFYAPQGISFQAKQIDLQSKKAVISREKVASSPEKDGAIEKSGLTNDMARDDASTEKDATDKAAIDEETRITNKAASKSIAKAETGTNDRQEKIPFAKKTNPLGGDDLKDSDKIYLYALLVIVAVYLMLRH